MVGCVVCTHVGGEEMLESVLHAGQGDAAHEEDYEDQVGERCRHVHNLRVEGERRVRRTC